MCNKSKGLNTFHVLAAGSESGRSSPYYGSLEGRPSTPTTYHAPKHFHVPASGEPNIYSKPPIYKRTDSFRLHFPSGGTFLPLTTPSAPFPSGGPPSLHRLPSCLHFLLRWATFLPSQRLLLAPTSSSGGTFLPSSQTPSCLHFSSGGPPSFPHQTPSCPTSPPVATSFPLTDSFLPPLPPPVATFLPSHRLLLASTSPSDSSALTSSSGGPTFLPSHRLLLLPSPSDSFLLHIPLRWAPSFPLTDSFSASTSPSGGATFLFPLTDSFCSTSPSTPSALHFPSGGPPSFPLTDSFCSTSPSGGPPSFPLTRLLPAPLPPPVGHLPSLSQTPSSPTSPPVATFLPSHRTPSAPLPPPTPSCLHFPPVGHLPSLSQTPSSSTSPPVGHLPSSHRLLLLHFPLRGPPSFPLTGLFSASTSPSDSSSPTFLLGGYLSFPLTDSSVLPLPLRLGHFLPSHRLPSMPPFSLRMGHFLPSHQTPSCLPLPPPVATFPSPLTDSFLASTPPSGGPPSSLLTGLLLPPSSSSTPSASTSSSGGSPSFPLTDFLPASTFLLRGPPSFPLTDFLQPPLPPLSRTSSCLHFSYRWATFLPSSQDSFLASLPPPVGTLPSLFTDSFPASTFPSGWATFLSSHRTPFLTPLPPTVWATSFPFSKPGDSFWPPLPLRVGPLSFPSRLLSCSTSPSGGATFPSLLTDSSYPSTSSFRTPSSPHFLLRVGAPSFPLTGLLPASHFFLGGHVETTPRNSCPHLDPFHMDTPSAGLHLQEGLLRQLLETPVLHLIWTHMDTPSAGL
ncbi:proline-rich protein 36-like [Salvelinus sp. IW2-2015]|uniref:proline-rich protein 36-like n=1 Tax=Salvelinus sp. IW2-2015 TaxID=2691554 RepID=UPI0038D4686D